MVSRRAALRHDGGAALGPELETYVVVRAAECRDELAIICSMRSAKPRGWPWHLDLEPAETAFSGSHQDAIRKCLLRQGPQDPW
jgi:hypothetical protein